MTGPRSSQDKKGTSAGKGKQQATEPNSELTLENIKSTLKGLIDIELNPKLTTLQNSVDNITERINTVEVSLQHASDRIDDIETKMIPAVQNKMDTSIEATVLKLLNLETHNRKWNLIITGLPGEAGEKESKTRECVLEFATQKLKVNPSGRLSACHRLKQSAAAPILVMFTDLAERNVWLSSAKNLKEINEKNKDKQIIISPDLPPVLRPLKADILKQRFQLPPEKKKLSNIKYLPTWPYVTLSINGEPTPRTPNFSKGTIINTFMSE